MGMVYARRFADRRFPGLLPEAVDDPVPRHSHQPCCDVFDGLHQSVRGNELHEGILHDVFDLAEISDLPAYECPKPGALRGHCIHDPSVVLARCTRRGQ